MPLHDRFKNETGLMNSMVETAQLLVSVAGTIQAFRYGDDLDKLEVGPDDYYQVLALAG